MKNPLVSKTSIIRQIANDHGTSQLVVRANIDAFLDALAQAAEEGKDVSLPGFGKFSVRERAARAGRNPKTGETVEIAASRTLAFKPASQVKTRMNA